MTAVDLQAMADGEAFQDDLFDETAFLGGFKEVDQVFPGFIASHAHISVDALSDALPSGSRRPSLHRTP